MKRLAAVGAALACLAAAPEPGEALPDAAAEARARALFKEVRCVVCQNEAIEDSDADLARDLRRIVREQVAAGRSDAEIKTWLVDRYGEFVLFKPAFSAGNALLWLGPFALVLVAGATLVVSRRRTPAPEEELSPEERERLQTLTRRPD